MNSPKKDFQKLQQDHAQLTHLLEKLGPDDVDTSMSISRLLEADVVDVNSISSLSSENLLDSDRIDPIEKSKSLSASEITDILKNLKQYEQTFDSGSEKSVDHSNETGPISESVESLDHTDKSEPAANSSKQYESETFESFSLSDKSKSSKETDPSSIHLQSSSISAEDQTIPSFNISTPQASSPIHQKPTEALPAVPPPTKNKHITFSEPAKPAAETSPAKPESPDSSSSHSGVSAILKELPSISSKNATSSEEGDDSSLERVLQRQILDVDALVTKPKPPPSEETSMISSVVLKTGGPSADTTKESIQQRIDRLLDDDDLPESTATEAKDQLAVPSTSHRVSDAFVTPRESVSVPVPAEKKPALPTIPAILEEPTSSISATKKEELKEASSSVRSSVDSPALRRSPMKTTSAIPVLAKRVGSASSTPKTPQKTLDSKPRPATSSASTPSVKSATKATAEVRSSRNGPLVVRNSFSKLNTQSPNTSMDRSDLREDTAPSQESVLVPLLEIDDLQKTIVDLRRQLSNTKQNLTVKTNECEKLKGELSMLEKIREVERQTLTTSTSKPVPKPAPALKKEIEEQERLILGVCFSLVHFSNLLF